MTTHIMIPEEIQPDRSFCLLPKVWLEGATILRMEDLTEDTPKPPDLCPVCGQTMHLLSHVVDFLQALGLSVPEPPQLFSLISETTAAVLRKEQSTNDQ